MSESCDGRSLWNVATGKPPSVVPHHVRNQLDGFLRCVLAITGDLGNLQLYNPATGSLEIVSQCGFRQSFLEFFSATHVGQAACGTALNRRERVIVEDVATDPIFVGTRAQKVMLEAGSRAVQSTPLLGSSSYPVGMLSSHYRKVGQPSARELLAIDRLAFATAKFIEQALGVVSSDAIAQRSNTVVAQTDGTYRIFYRGASGSSHWVRDCTLREQALETVRNLSLTDPGEFVLFHGMNVIAVAEHGIVGPLRVEGN